MKIEERLKYLGLILPETPTAVGSYQPAVLVGDMLYLSGTGGIDPGRQPVFGKVGSELSIEEGYASAKGAVLNFLSTIKDVLGDLDRVEKVVKLLCMVNCKPDFTRQPEVANGASDLLLKVFGDETGAHARSAIGVCSLPFNIPVELEMIVKVRPQ